MMLLGKNPGAPVLVVAYKAAEIADRSFSTCTVPVLVHVLYNVAAWLEWDQSMSFSHLSKPIFGSYSILRIWISCFFIRLHSKTECRDLPIIYWLI